MLSTPLHIIEGQLGRKKIQNSLFAYFFQLPSRLPTRDFSSKEKELDSEMKWKWGDFYWIVQTLFLAK